MSIERLPWLWRAENLGRGLSLLADEAGLHPARSTESPMPMPSDPERIGDWIDALATWNELEVESISAAYGELDALVTRVGPALLSIRSPADPREVEWILVIGPAFGRRAQSVRVLAPDGEIHRVPAEDLVRLLKSPLDSDHRASTEALLARAQVPAARRSKAVDALLIQRLADAPIMVGFMIRSAPSADFRARLARVGTFSSLGWLLLGHSTQYALWLLSWWLMGRAALGGTLAAGWMTAWVLLLLSLVPLRMGTSWLMGSLSIRIGGELKRRLLQGALSLDRDAMRSEGAGGALGRVIEAEAVEALAMSGGLMTLTSLIELPFALWVLSQGLSGGSLVAVLLMTGLFALWAGLRFHGALGVWTMKRLTMTHGLVEKMAGHRTRLVQDRDRHLHREEDLELKNYLQHLNALDRALIRLLLLPRSWMVLALAVAAPAFIGAQGAPGVLAVAIGGILLIQGILGSLAGGLTTLGAAWISWTKVEPLFRAGGRRLDLGLPHLTLEPTPETPQAEASQSEAPQSEGEVATVDAPIVVQAKDLGYRYAARTRPVLSNGELTIRAGDRILVEGPSGGGKSTLASLLVGLRQPTTGTLSLHGLDRGSLGLDAWRRRVVLVPQFHDNHVLTETFAFNLLMGKGWPAKLDDLREAWTVCTELGLGDLLKRMPSGLQQMVGETGWQLSHGERSRLFLARALLQDADLLILDESFAALDPENLQLAMDCARKRGRTVMVIAHP